MFVYLCYKCFKYFCNMKYAMIIWLIWGTVIINYSCKSHQKQLSDNKTPIQDSTSFFPMQELLQEEVNDVNTTPYFMYKIKTNDKGQKDSTVIYAKEWTQLAQPFLNIDINSPSLKQQLQQSIFHDLTTKCYSFTYTPKSVADTSSIKSVLILLDDNNNKLKDIFIHKIYHHSDTTIIEALLWKPTNYFSINKTFVLHDSIINKNQLIVNWKH